MVRDFNTPQSIIERTSREKISKDIDNLNTVNQLDPTEMYRTFQ